LNFIFFFLFAEKLFLTGRVVPSTFAIGVKTKFLLALENIKYMKGHYCLKEEKSKKGRLWLQVVFRGHHFPRTHKHNIIIIIDDNNTHFKQVKQLG
jgi:hypothetical protein